MIRYFRTVADQLKELEGPEAGCWAHAIAPTPGELEQLHCSMGAPLDFLQAALDEEESARIDVEDGCTLLVIDIPTVEAENAAYLYSTLPMGIVLTADSLVTVCTRESPVFNDLIEQRVRGGVHTSKRTRFILQLLGRVTGRFLSYLKQIDKASIRVENELHKSMKNKELIQMLKLEKSLVFFSTSIKGNEVVLERMLRQEHIQKYPEDAELLEDVIIENKQAMEMCGIYRDILSGTMDAFASIISNNLNIVMKVMTSLSLVLSVPTLVASIWGINVPLPFANDPNGFLIVMGISLVLALAAFTVLWRKKMF
ncbi:MAG TPA: magnesium transporter CorA family protein [Clostridia bacterium]|nr:magnesium transporter CorA family protein [Clostridia bacterium]